MARPDKSTMQTSLADEAILRGDTIRAVQLAKRTLGRSDLSDALRNRANDIIYRYEPKKLMEIASAARQFIGGDSAARAKLTAVAITRSSIKRPHRAKGTLRCFEFVDYLP